MHKLVDVGSSETEELVRFIATARSRRPEAWGYVERLKAACSQTTGNNPELRDLLRRVWRLEHEIESLRAQSLTLQAQLARTVAAVPVKVLGAANANDYSDSDNA